jgi:two-component system phosphate regulon sensor histidine kinase PhoR
MMVEDVLSNEESDYEEQISFKNHFYRVRAQVIRRSGHLFIGLALQDVSNLVRLNRARRDMVANISHEMNTPITKIRLIIDGLFLEQEKPKRKQSTSALKAVGREIEALMRLGQELLDLSMIESGQAIMRAIEIPLVELVDNAIERLEDQSDEKDIEIRDEVSKDLRVLADRDQVQRVLLNLIHNAIKWSPPKEKIRVRAESSGDEVIITVLDRGPGVPEDQRERIFERFYQVDKSRSAGGTGLGLAICKHIVEAHGGRIWVEDNPESKDGRGGSFKFTLLAAEVP